MVALVQNRSPCILLKLLKVGKAEDALSLPFRGAFDPLRGEAEWCQNCTLASPVSHWQQLHYEEKNVVWCDLEIAQLSLRTLQELYFTHEMLLEDASSSVVLKTDSPASQKKEVIINYEKNINENPRNSLQKHLSVGMEL